MTKSCKTRPLFRRAGTKIKDMVRHPNVAPVAYAKCRSAAVQTTLARVLTKRPPAVFSPLPREMRGTTHPQARRFDDGLGTRVVISKRGRTMRLFVVTIVALSVTGCANHTSDASWSILKSQLGGPAQADVQRDPRDLSDLHKPTVANKTLSAMALQRATGIEPHPARLVDFE